MAIPPQSSIEQRLDAIAQQLAEIREILEGRPPSKDYYSPHEFAKIVGRSYFTVRQWCRLGRINAEKKKHKYGLNHEWLISHEELQRYRNFGILPPPRAGQGRTKAR